MHNLAEKGRAQKKEIFDSMPSSQISPFCHFAKSNQWHTMYNKFVELFYLDPGGIPEEFFTESRILSNLAC
jgi:hypothetical protein